MMDHGCEGLKMGKGNIHLQMGITIGDHFIRECGMGVAVTNGKTRVAMKGSGVEIRCMDMEYM